MTELCIHIALLVCVLSACTKDQSDLNAEIHTMTPDPVDSVMLTVDSGHVSATLYAYYSTHVDTLHWLGKSSFVIPDTSDGLLAIIFEGKSMDLLAQELVIENVDPSSKEQLISNQTYTPCSPRASFISFVADGDVIGLVYETFHSPGNRIQIDDLSQDSISGSFDLTMSLDYNPVNLEAPDSIIFKQGAFKSVFVDIN